MIAGDSTSPAANAVDDCKSLRRLIDPLFMASSPQALFFRDLLLRPRSACCGNRVVAVAQFNLLGKFYHQTEAPRKSASRAGRTGSLLGPRDGRAVPIRAGGIFQPLAAAFDHRR